MAGIAALVLATFSTVIRIKVITTSDLAGHQAAFTGADRHSVALLLIGAIALPMAIGGLRGARPAMAMVVLAGVATLIIAVGVDLPDLHKTGAIGRDYAQATAGPGSGYYAETLGGVLLLLAGGGMFVVASSLSQPAGPPVDGRRRRDPRRPAAPAAVAAPPELDSWL